MQLNKLQKSVLIGSLLGDGCIEKDNRRNGKNKGLGCNFREEHSERQKDYLEWKARILSEQVKKVERDFGTVYQLRTKKDETYKQLRNEWYPNGKKIVPKSLMENMNEIILAVWYFDDGDKIKKEKKMKYLNGLTQCNRARISTHAFTYKENLFLRRILHKKFGILPNVEKEWKVLPKKQIREKYYRLHFNSRTRMFDKLMEIVKRQFYSLKIPECMKYKIGERVESRRGITQSIILAKGLIPRKNGRFCVKGVLQNV